MWDTILIIGMIILFVRSNIQSSKIKVIEKKLHDLQSKDTSRVNTTTPATQSEDSIAIAIEYTKQTNQSIHKPDKPITTNPMAYKDSNLLQTISKALKSSPITKKIVNFFTMGNLPTKIGVLILIAGVGFLLKDISPRFEIPIALRLIIVALVGIIALALGIKLHNKTHKYGLILQGGGFAILYAVVIFGYNQYNIINYIPALIMLVTIAVSSIIMALRQNSKELIIFAELGGFMLPLMVSNTNGSIYNLFTYYAILNIIIAIIAWFKNWRILNLIGFIATFVIATTLGILQYNTTHYLGVQLYLAYFIILYIVIAILFVSKESDSKRNKLNGSIIFGVPLIGFSLQCGLVNSFNYGASISAYAFATLYAITSGLLLLNKQKFKFLIYAFNNFIVIFITLGILLLWQYHLTESFFAIEGALLIWFGKKTARNFHIRAGSCLVGLSVICAINLLIESGLARPIETNSLIINLIVCSATYIAAFLFSDNIYNRKADTASHTDILTLGIANFLIIFSLVNYLWFTETLAQLALCVITYILWFIALKTRWHLGIKATLWLIVLNSALVGLRWLYLGSTTSIAPFSQLLIIFANYFILVRTNKIETLARPVRICDMFLQVVIIMQIIICWLNSATHLNISNEWQFIGTGILICLITFVYSKRPKFINFPIAQSEGVLRTEFSFTLISMMYIITTLYNLAFINYAASKFYIPFINPLDIVMGCTFGLMIYIFNKDYKKLASPMTNKNIIQLLIGIWTFIWLTWIALRSVHSYFGIAYNMTIFNSMITQTALSILWAVIGFTLTIIASKTAKRTYWIIGGSLLIIVVIKMLVFDMSGVNNLTRVVSFIGVGVILLLVGYFAPVPPKNQRTK